jgi:hypothetical protein
MTLDLLISSRESRKTSNDDESRVGRTPHPPTSLVVRETAAMLRAKAQVRGGFRAWAELESPDQWARVTQETVPFSPVSWLASL